MRTRRFLGWSRNRGGIGGGKGLKTVWEGKLAYAK